MVRHAQTDWNVEPMRCQGWADVPLNERGREQARDEGRRLARRGIRRIVSSHLARAAQTAELIRTELEASGDTVELAFDERLAETRRGRWEGLPFAAIIRDEPATWRAYREHPERFRFPGGESLANQQRRVLRAVRDAAADGRPSIVVTHGGSIRLLRAFLAGGGLERFHQVRVATGETLEVCGNGLVTRIDTFLAAEDGGSTGEDAARPKERVR